MCWRREIQFSFYNKSCIQRPLAFLVSVVMMDVKFLKPQAIVYECRMPVRERQRKKKENSNKPDEVLYNTSLFIYRSIFGHILVTTHSTTNLSKH